ncbi:MAG: hypothetical protein HQ522_00195 [Bacteroidetes bacterium]|nr:hypothetical protein [Bacteroidota bacterium]
MRILFTVILIAMIMGAYAQKASMTLTFTADSNNQHVPLNSILIENLTQGGDTTLYAPDTTLVLDYITGMQEISSKGSNGFSLSQNYPNPIENKTTIGLYLPEKKGVLVIISDVIGRELLNKEFQLKQGNHSFTFYPGRESFYFLTVKAFHQRQTVKMFNSPNYAYGSGSFKLEYNGQHAVLNEYKSEMNLYNFVYDHGDHLKFTSFTNLGERVITSTPTDAHTYSFHYTGDPCPGTPTITDIDGNVYNTVQIGSQCWMKENLKTTTYNNGTSIPNVTNASTWSNLSSGAYVWYSNNNSWKESFGALYNWYAMVDANGLCPDGWHIPSDDEWTELINYIGHFGLGNELKSCRQVNSPLGGGCNTSEHPRWSEAYVNYGTDDYGFSGLAGGTRDFNGTFWDIGIYTGWWSSTENSPSFAWGRYLSNNLNFVYIYTYPKRDGFRVRCLRD